MKCYFLTSDARNLIHISEEDTETVQKQFPEYTVVKLQSSVTPNCFYYVPFDSWWGMGEVDGAPN